MIYKFTNTYIKIFKYCCWLHAQLQIPLLKVNPLQEGLALLLGAQPRGRCEKNSISRKQQKTKYSK